MATVLTQAYPYRYLAALKSLWKPWTVNPERDKYVALIYVSKRHYVSTQNTRGKQTCINRINRAVKLTLTTCLTLQESFCGYPRRQKKRVPSAPLSTRSPWSPTGSGMNPLRRGDEAASSRLSKVWIKAMGLLFRCYWSRFAFNLQRFAPLKVYVINKLNV